MILNNEQAIKKIKADGACLIDIWEGFTNKTDEMHRFHKIMCDNTDALIDYVSGFIADFPGKYTVICRKAENQAIGQGTKFNVEFISPIAVKTPTPVQPVQPVVDPTKPHFPNPAYPPMTMNPTDAMAYMYNIAKGEIANEFKGQFFQNQYQMMKDENERMKEPAYKLSFLIEHLIGRMVMGGNNNPNNPNVMSNGTNGGGSGNTARFMNGVNQQQQQQQQPIQQQQQPNLNPTEKAIVYMVNEFGEEKLQKFAMRMQQDPQFNNMIKGFLTSL